MTERRCIYIGLPGLVVALIGMAIPWYGRAAADVLGGPLPAPTLSSDIVQLTPVEKLGKLMLYDSTLSNPPGYSCATCHVPETGFTGPNSEINAFSGPQPGVVPGRFSNRKPQSYLYAAFSPVGPYYDSGLKTWLGGGFWNGRVPDLATQALQPPLNPNEMTNIPEGPYRSKKYSGHIFRTESEALAKRRVCKGHWLEIRHGTKICYAQWEDVGPFRTDSARYVFGDQRPSLNVNRSAGIDVSPAVRDYLGLGSLDLVDWRFVEEADVAAGPWSQYEARAAQLVRLLLWLNTPIGGSYDRNRACSRTVYAMGASSRIPPHVDFDLWNLHSLGLGNGRDTMTYAVAYFLALLFFEHNQYSLDRALWTRKRE